MKIKKTHMFQKRGDYVVVGKNMPRSVGLMKRSAVKYAEYFKEKGKKPRIIRIK